MKKRSQSVNVKHRKISFGDFQTETIGISVKKILIEVPIINPRLKVENIPLLAYDYVINGKSALEWVMERYSYSVHPESKITNNPNAWGEEHGDPHH